MAEQEIVYLPLSELHISEQNVRPGALEKTEDWEEFVASVKAGLKEPLLIQDKEVIDGGMRLRALQEISSSSRKAVDKDPLVPCVREPKQEAVEQLVTSSITNLQRRNLSPQEWASVIERLKKMGLNQARIAKSLGKTEAWVSMVKGGQKWSEHKLKPKEGQEPIMSERSETFECPSCGVKIDRLQAGMDVRYNISNQDNAGKPLQKRRGKK